MDGGVVLLVATQLDDMGVSAEESQQQDLDALCRTNQEVQALRTVWDTEVAPLCSRYRGALRIDTRFLAVSSKEGFEGTLDLLRDRIRDNIEEVFLSYSSLIASLFSDP